MKVLYLPPRMIRLGCMVVVGVLLGFLMAGIGETIARSTFGVKPGVTIDGLQVGGMFRHELRALLKRLANEQSRPAHNAMYVPESGEIVSEEPGLEVDVELNLRRVLAAVPGKNLPLAVKALPAAISVDFFTPVYRGNETRPRVSLAINVAWGEEYIPTILDILARENVKATFFFVGTWVRQFPDLTRRIALAGHEIGNHGLYHGHPTQMGRTELQRLIRENDDLLRKASGIIPSKLFAPPYGEVNDQVTATAADMGYRTIMWTLDTIDWMRPSPDLIIKRACERADKGTIILMHPTGPTVAALPEVIRRLRQQGLTPVTVSENLKP